MGRYAAVHRGRPIGRGVAALAAAAALVVATPSAGEERQVVITPSGVVPDIVTARTEERVTFVNRTGRLVHVEFDGAHPGHRVFQVPGEIWAVFHRPGPHPYVVHGWTGQQIFSRGVVNVEAGPGPEIRTCTGISVMEVCLEP